MAGRRWLDGGWMVGRRWLESLDVVSLRILQLYTRGSI